MSNRKRLISGFTVAALSLGIAGCRPFTASISGHAINAASASAVGVTGIHDRYRLQSMPTGTVLITRTTGQRLRAHVNMFGLTPGSAHGVYIDEPDGHRIPFPVLTADSTGHGAATLTSLRSVEWHAEPGRFVIQLGPTTDPTVPIAETAVLPPQPGSETAGTLPAVSHGYATLSYEQNDRTLAVTITAHGLNPGPHAAHIHIGSCRSQGPVKYLLADFIADTHGDIVNQTRTIKNVSTKSAHDAWYLDLHQGATNQIRANGAPTSSFRPLLCTNITGSN